MISICIWFEYAKQICMKKDRNIDEGTCSLPSSGMLSRQPSDDSPGDEGFGVPGVVVISGLDTGTGT